MAAAVVPTIEYDLSSSGYCIMSIRNQQGIVFVTLLSILIGYGVALAGGNTKKGKRLYNQYCIQCHGRLGAGDGDRVRNEKLHPQPRIHANGIFMNRLPDMRLYRVIKYGGRSVNFSHIMPQWQHILSDEEILDVIAHIRSLAYPPYVPRVAIE